MMHHKLAALFLPVFFVGAAFFITTPHSSLTTQVAHAASDGCPDTHSPPCVTLIVKLNPAPSSNASVVAVRQGPTSGADERVVLNATSPGTYTSGHPIAYSNDLGTCSGGQVSKANLFNITVSGSATGSSSNINICYNSNPKADRNGIKTVTVSVSTASAPSTKGGISGVLKINAPNGETIACPAAGVTLNDKYYSSVTVGAQGDFNTGLILDPGKYKLTADCPFQGQPYHFSVDNIQVAAGKITTIATQTSSGTDSSPAPLTEAEKACIDFTDKSDIQKACIAGYDAGSNGKTEAEACDGYGASGSKPHHSKEFGDACVVGYKAAASTTSGDDTSACIANSHTSLEWILCPVITALSDATEAINNFVENQLRFDVGSFLPENGENAGAYKAWSVLRDLATSVLVIILLVMIFSQAAGSGLFEAYTIRKILPRLVIAVIAIQVSWELCRFAIDLTNSLGDGLAQIMAAPFGGRGNLDLSSLLNHLGGAAAGIASAASLGAIVVSVAFLGPILAPGALLVAFSIFMSVLIGLASVLFRNIEIVACVIFMPIALILWIIPNQSMKKYWNLWSDNFTKALLLFPIMIAIIYAGRIFAYIAGDTAGGATNVGFLNFIMIFVGFFAPYAILPKAFKWGGSLMSSGANAISSNALVKKGGDLGKKEIGEALQRRQGKAAKAYDPNAPMLGFKRKFGVLPVPTGRMVSRIQSGSFMPTERGRRLTIQKGDKWSGEQDEMAQALLKRAGEKVMGGYQTFHRNDEGELVKIKRNAAGKMVDVRTGAVTDDIKAASYARRQIDAAGNHMEDAAGNKLYTDVFGNTTTDINKAYETTALESEAGTKTLSGVAAMKQKWVDLMDDDEADAAVKKMAARQLLATVSYPEIQGSFTSKGKRVFETDAWEPSIITSPEDYPRVLRSRVDSTPHVMEAGKKDAEKLVPGAGTGTDMASRNLRSNRRIKYAIDQQMGNEDFQTQSEGFWQETARVANLRDATGGLTPQAIEIRDALKNRFQAIRDAGPTVRQQMLAHLKNGGSLEANVNAILDTGGTGDKLDNYLV
jgi:hypothetical protein